MGCGCGKDEPSTARQNKPPKGYGGTAESHVSQHEHSEPQILINVINPAAQQTEQLVWPNEPVVRLKVRLHESPPSGWGPVPPPSAFTAIFSGVKCSDTADCTFKSLGMVGGASIDAVWEPALDLTIVVQGNGAPLQVVGWPAERLLSLLARAYSRAGWAWNLSSESTEYQWEASRPETGESWDILQLDDTLCANRLATGDSITCRIMQRRFEWATQDVHDSRSPQGGNHLHYTFEGRLEHATAPEAALLSDVGCFLDVGAVVESFDLRCEWKDQGWGGQKGRIVLSCYAQDSTLRFRQDLLGLAPKEWTAERKGGHIPAWPAAQEGDKAVLEYCVGGDGGHELHVRGLTFCLVVR